MFLANQIAHILLFIKIQLNKNPIA